MAADNTRSVTERQRVPLPANSDGRSEADVCCACFLRSMICASNTHSPQEVRLFSGGSRCRVRFDLITQILACRRPPLSATPEDCSSRAGYMLARSLPGIVTRLIPVTGPTHIDAATIIIAPGGDPVDRGGPCDESPDRRRRAEHTADAPDGSGGVRAFGHDVGTADDAVRLVEGAPYDVALVDLRLGTDSGLDLLRAASGAASRLAIVVITAHASSIDTAVEAMRRGAFDYLPKPFTPAQVRAVLERAARLKEPARSGHGPGGPGAPRGARGGIAGTRSQVRRILDLGRRVASPMSPILIRGESGTGKGVLARAAHAWSRRARRPVRHGQLSQPERRTARERPVRPRPRRVHRRRPRRRRQGGRRRGRHALPRRSRRPPPALQPKLLRFLQDGSTSGSATPGPGRPTCGSIAATNRDLEAADRRGTVPRGPALPAQRPRAELPAAPRTVGHPRLADHLLAFFARQIGQRLTGFTPEARAPWPAIPGRATSASCATPSSAP